MLSFSMAQQVVAEMKTSGADVACECWWLLDVVVSVSAGKNSCGLEGRLSLWLLHWSRPAVVRVQWTVALLPTFFVYF